MTPNIGHLERQDPNNSILGLGDTENRVTEPGSCGRSPECSAEPRAILLGFVHLAKGDSPPLSLLSLYKDAFFSPVTAEWAQGHQHSSTRSLIRSMEKNGINLLLYLL